MVTIHQSLLMHYLVALAPLMKSLLLLNLKHGYLVHRCALSKGHEDVLYDAHCEIQNFGKATPSSSGQTDTHTQRGTQSDTEFSQVLAHGLPALQQGLVPE